jgi:carboxypeptidase Taq
MPDPILTLRSHLADVEDLRYAAQLLEWDQQTMMPPAGGEARADALATLGRVAHEAFISERTGALLEAAERAAESFDWDSDEAALTRVTRRGYDKARLVPSQLAAELARAGSIGQEAWVAAREQSDFAAFAPHLERNLELARQYVDCFQTFDCAYDALLDDYEPGMRAAEVDRLFGELRDGLVPLIATLREHADRVDDGPLHGQFDIGAQRRLARDVIGLMGFTEEAWRFDDAVHPFAAGIGGGDVRITTRWEEAYFASSLFGAMHECGHGLYEAGVDDRLRRSPLGHGESLGLHESQSRLWENMVGRGRPFAEALVPRIERAFGAPGAALDPDTLFRAVNKVRPSLIRVEADEATYGLHIVLRFELEQELIEGRLAVADLPRAWNERMERYLGIAVPDDAQGVLQDVHWSAGLIGYFPTYALGNLIAGQLWARAQADIPDLESDIAAGELAPLREWLREHVHRHGAKFRTAELLERVVGGPIVVEPFLDYLRTKLGTVYDVTL